MSGILLLWSQHRYSIAELMSVRPWLCFFFTVLFVCCSNREDMMKHCDKDCSTLTDECLFRWL